MDTREYIESGILELYVYGLLTDAENAEVAEMATKNREIDEEIVAIEKAVISLSSGFAPPISVDMYDQIREKLQLKYANVIAMKPRRNFSAYFGWAASLLLLLGIGYLYVELNESYDEVVTIDNQKKQLENAIDTLKANQLQTETALAVVRDTSNAVVKLTGQAASPDALAIVYWNRQTKSVYVDAAGLPTPPNGMVYQVWALKLDPLTPTSIGLLENFEGADKKLFAVSAATEPQAFGITLEPAGGSVTPTLEQLYTMGEI